MAALKTYILMYLLSGLFHKANFSLQGEEVAKWANAIGDQLWMLGREVTKIAEIEQKYAHLNAKVEEKDPTTLLLEIKENILRMMDRKMDAIRCIQQKAEEVAETAEVSSANYSYYSSKYSSYDFSGTNKSREIELPKSLTLQKLNQVYRRMYLNNDTHFYDLPVNTSHSSVHVPTNLYDIEFTVAEAIQWSEALDEIFAQNYKSDPALSWQYFGSSTGIMRHYPAMHWIGSKREMKVLFDCRIRTWFIEAATCTKDVVILVDNSGSMDGMGKHIGYLTAVSILDTFSNNDYVNVLNYSDTTSYVVPCFEKQLVQATKENVHIFKDAINKLEPNGKTNLEQALVMAFGILSEYRNIRECNEGNSTSCNQAIMIITDGANANYSETVRKYNYLSNGANIPVRIFSYLVGQEVASPEEMMWISCSNRGYYTHVQTLEQVTASVLEYINVIARPLVLQEEDHPVSWTHAYVDVTYYEQDEVATNESYRLLTSAAIPCFDRKINKMNDSRTALLLGVAGTDVPIDEFRKLTTPYKIGVNAYSYIVSNNGYVLMHPDLRPVFQGILKENYNSIDLTEVEQFDEDSPPRQISDTLQKIRLELVKGSSGSIHNITIKYHYDNYRRVAEETYDYYYTPLEGSPFSMAIAIPQKYGKYGLNVGDQIKTNRFTGIDLTSFFKGKWRIHPKWVYCRYHYLEGHEFETSEEELIHFLEKMYDDLNVFKWERQYEAKEKEDINQIECGRKTLDDDDYYCDEQLVQRLIFDAKNTYEPFNEPYTFQSEAEEDLFRHFKVSLWFVATMSGLTRWEVFERPDDANNTDTDKPKIKEFGDLNPRAIDEKWYKSAVQQHQYDTESFVYSVPFDSAGNADTRVTGSYAIFVKDAGFEAPGCVVGFQFHHTNFINKVDEITSKPSVLCPRCGKCGERLACYIVDHSGYIVVSPNEIDTGRFFGEVEGDTLHSMLLEGIFKKKILYDYQGLCKYDKNDGSGGSIVQSPMSLMWSLLQWFLGMLMYSLNELSLYKTFNSVFIFAQQDNSTIEMESDNSEAYDTGDEDTDSKNYYACETEMTLFMLQQNKFIKDNFHGEITHAERPYYVKRIPNSNLIFVAIESRGVTSSGRVYTTAPMQISKKPEFNVNEMNSTLLACNKLYLNNLYRRRLAGCYNEHPLEHEIQDCGKSAALVSNVIFLIFCLYFNII